MISLNRIVAYRKPTQGHSSVRVLEIVASTQLVSAKKGLAETQQKVAPLG